MAQRRIGISRRHLAKQNRLADRRRPRAYFLVSGERHWSHLPRPMALDAGFLQDRETSRVNVGVGPAATEAVEPVSNPKITRQFVVVRVPPW